MKKILAVSVFVLLSGCTHVQTRLGTAQETVCANSEKIKKAAQATIDSLNRLCAVKPDAQQD
jgi:hypothetical protein